MLFNEKKEEKAQISKRIASAQMIKTKQKLKV